MAPKLYKATEVCDLTQLQPFVLRSWEKEFPGIGIQKSPDAQRLYRQSDVDQVLRIKQLVFGEGLTLAGARRRLEEMAAAPVSDEEVTEVLDALASDARTRIAHVREGLQSILRILSSAPGPVVVVDDYRLEPPPMVPVGAKPRSLTLRRKAAEAAPAAVRSSKRTDAKRGKSASA
jgi:DNA-binding transcriptional MerR regulator